MQMMEATQLESPIARNLAAELEDAQDGDVEENADDALMEHAHALCLRRLQADGALTGAGLSPIGTPVADPNAADQEVLAAQARHI
jgi:hypothetical protein